MIASLASVARPASIRASLRTKIWPASVSYAPCITCANDTRTIHMTSTAFAAHKPSAKRKRHAHDKAASRVKPTPSHYQLRKFDKSMKRRQAAQPNEVPPACLTRTASPHVYIARSAILNDQTGEVYLDPKSLFSELYGSDPLAPTKSRPLGPKRRTVIPRVFRQCHLQYVSPAAFPNHEPPTDGTPEVAFLGRSNTGKSSLINALHSLLLRSNGGTIKGHVASGGGELARTSKTPGRTQTVNYFGLVPSTNKDHHTAEEAKLFLVDLPGFGYASAPDETVDEWQERTQQFLISRTLIPEDNGKGVIQPWPRATVSTSRNERVTRRGSRRRTTTTPPLKRLYLLIDSRLPEPQFLDLSVMGWCDDHSIPYTVVLTKVDGSSRAHCVKLTNQLCMRYHSLFLDHAFSEDEGPICMDPVVYWTSAKDGLGMEELLLSIEGCVLDENDEDESMLLDHHSMGSDNINSTEADMESDDEDFCVEENDEKN